MIVYVYHDEDHGCIEVFYKLEDAMKLGWGAPGETWELAYTKNGEPVAWRMSEYCAIYKREVE